MPTKEYSGDKYNRELIDYSAILKKGFWLYVNQTFDSSQECDTIVKRYSRTYFEEHHIQDTRIV